MEVEPLRQSDKVNTKQTLDKNTEMVEIKNETQQIHTTKLSFNNKKDSNYNPCSKAILQLQNMDRRKIIVRST